MATWNAVQLRVAAFVLRAAGGNEAGGFPVQVNGATGLIGAIDGGGFFRGTVRERAVIVLREMEQLDDRAETGTRLKTDGRRSPALVREQEIVKNIECQRFRGRGHERNKRTPNRVRGPEIRAAPQRRGSAGRLQPSEFPRRRVCHPVLAKKRPRL
jgi:hypothetical protein